MPDAEGRILGIAVPKLPPSMQRCERTGLTKPECGCPTCYREMLTENFSRGTKAERPEPPDVAA